MSAEVKANAGLAKGTGAAHNASVTLTLTQPGSAGHKGQPAGHAAAIGRQASSRRSAGLADRARDLRGQGWTVEQIAEKLDRSPRQVSRYLKPSKP
jgi:hypothetical protein